MKGLADLVHLDGRLHAGEGADFFQRVLKRECVDDSGQHTHLVGGDAVHVFGLLGHAAEEVAAADDDRDLHPQVAHFS